MDEREFNALVESEWEAMPEKFKERVVNVALLIEDEPSDEIREEEGLAEGETLLGHYHGIPNIARGSEYGVGGTLPDTITLYRLPILDEAEELTDLPAPRSGFFFVYALLCENDAIYIGQTQDLQKRFNEHCNGRGADFTKNFRPSKIVHFEEYPSREEAVRREKELKTGFGRKWLKREIEAGRARQAGDHTGDFKRNVAKVVRETIWHEVGHYMGFDEEPINAREGEGTNRFET